MAQVTLRVNEGSIQKKFDKLKNLYGDTVEERLVNFASYGIMISPVDTGAYVESMSIRPRGSSGGRMRRSDVRDTAPNKEAKKQEAVGLIRTDAATYIEQIIDRGGAVIVNRSPHNKDVESKYQVFGRMKDRFR